MQDGLVYTHQYSGLARRTGIHLSIQWPCCSCKTDWYKLTGVHLQVEYPLEGAVAIGDDTPVLPGEVERGHLDLEHPWCWLSEEWVCRAGETIHSLG